MKYVLIMTEGTTELTFMNILLERKLLIFSKDELLMEEIFHKRNIDGELIGFIQMIPSGDTVDIYRIGDTLNEKLRIPQSILKDKIQNIQNICTIPEFEILLIINEGKFEDFLKHKSKIKPSDYYKQQIDHSYNKQSSYIENYFSEMTDKEIIDLICLYVKKHGKSHCQNQNNLKSIIKIEK